MSFFHFRKKLLAVFFYKSERYLKSYKIEMIYLLFSTGNTKLITAIVLKFSSSTKSPKSIIKDQQKEEKGENGFNAKVKFQYPYAG